MSAAEKSRVRRQRRRVRALQHEVLRRGYELLFRAGVAAPQQKDYRLFPFVEFLYHGVGDILPAFALVGIRLPRPHGEDGVEISAHGTR